MTSFYLVTDKGRAETHLLLPDESRTACGVEMPLRRREDEDGTWRKHAGGVVTCPRCCGGGMG